MSSSTRQRYILVRARDCDDAVKYTTRHMSALPPLYVVISSAITRCDLTSSMIFIYLTTTTQPLYMAWAKKNDFKVMLPKEVAARNQAAAAATAKLSQTTLDAHVKEMPPPPDRPIPYSHRLFREAAIEWLAATDQVCRYLFHSSTMILTDSTLI